MQAKDKILFITSVPSFYKNLLFKELAELADVQVFYSNRSPIKRDKDFFNYLDQSLIVNLRSKSYIRSLAALYKAGKTADRIYYGAWDDIYYWIFAFLMPKRKNHAMVESSIFEYSDSSILKKLLNFIKQQFLNRNCTCVASGHPQEILVRKLGFKGNVIQSLGVGLLDFKYPPVSKPNTGHPIQNFLYIGRLCKLKGTDMLINTFSKFPYWHLHLAGVPEDNFLISDVPNITLHGYKKREELKDIFHLCDVFILPSLIEPWGLVIEEALYHGLPVLASDKVGCQTDLVTFYDAGFIFKAGDVQSLERMLHNISDINTYHRLQKNIRNINFESRKQHYINSFLQC